MPTRPLAPDAILIARFGKAALVLKVPSTDTTLSTAKRYWILRAKVASTSSLQPASIDLARIPGIYSAAA